MTNNELEKRDLRSQNLLVYQINDSDYFVESSKGLISYKVHLNNGHKSCSCGDYANKIQSDAGFMCKHILAVVNGNGNLKNAVAVKRKPRLDERWITSIKGKDFVVYSGLLDLAHQMGLQSMEVEVEQYPSKDNGNEAICKAVTHSNDGQVFVDYGDANPRNTSSMVVNHLIRVASTRAKARTLRDMTNIGMTCLEELGGEEDVVEVSAKKAPAKTKSTKKEVKESAKNVANEPEKKSGTKSEAAKNVAKEPEKSSDEKTDTEKTSNDKPSSAQINAIKNLAYRRGLKDDDINAMTHEKLKIPFHELSAGQAGQLIKLIQQSA